VQSPAAASDAARLGALSLLLAADCLQELVIASRYISIVVVVVVDC
jgi:hypothetical protein